MPIFSLKRRLKGKVMNLNYIGKRQKINFIALIANGSFLPECSIINISKLSKFAIDSVDF
jgi:hypothetical protein